MSVAGNREDGLSYQLVGLIPNLRRFARGLAKDPDRADDLVQDACERALRHLNRSGKEVRLNSLLFRIIYNLWIDNLRRRKTRRTKLIFLSERNKSTSYDYRDDNQLDVALDLDNALGQLDAEHRAAVILICVEGYSYAEAADVLEVPAGTVASRVARARAKLGRLLYSRFNEPLTLNKDEPSGEKHESGI
ncbi:MAG: RNA polymerase sigma factor [Desulfobacterales bacterium]|nr:RNA polymerase sigma factor [Desulfobacterales bacterium]